MNPIIFIAFFVLISSPNFVSAELIRNDEIKECKILADHYFYSPDQVRKIWLRSTITSETSILMATYSRDASLVFSPDCSMIALNDNLASNVSEVHLFRRVKGLKYQPVNVDVTGKAWKALSESIALKNGLRLGHHYINAVTWSADSKSVLLRLWGHTDINNHVDNWYCIYHVDSEQIKTDLSFLNRHSITFRNP